MLPVPDLPSRTLTKIPFNKLGDQLKTNNIGPDKESKTANIFLPISLNMCLGCSKEPSHLDGSFGYPQHMF